MSTTRPLDDPPEPLVPEGVDLRGYEFMPLHGDVLRRSGFNVRATDAEYRAAMNLWWSCWWETPAASLPNDERDLMKLAGLSDIRRWRKVRPVVMEKWVLSSDNRWYHPFLANLALAAFAKRRSQSNKGRIGAQKRWGNKAAPHGTGNGTGNGTAMRTDSSGNAPAIADDGTGNSKRSEVNTPQPPTATSTSKPRAAARSAEKVDEQLADQRTWTSSPPPPGFMDTWKHPVDHFKPIRAKAPPEPEQHQGDDHGQGAEGHETLDS